MPGVVSSLKWPRQPDGRWTESKLDHGVEDGLELFDLVPQPDEVEADDRLVLRDHLQGVKLRPSQPLLKSNPCRGSIFLIL